LIGAACRARRAEPPAPSASRPDADGTIELIAVGDLMPARDVEKAARDAAGARFADHVFAGVAPVLAKADVVFGNFECVASRRGSPVEKAYTMRADPGVLPAMARAGFDVLSLANNHSLDYGEDALEDTWDGILAAGMIPSGIRFRASTAAQTAARLRVGTRTLAFLSYTDVFPSSFRGLYPGPFPADPARIRSDVKRAKADAHHVIVSLHAGREYSLRPTRKQRTLADAALLAGATLVLQHHTHTPQPVEVDLAGSRAVAFGLGNFAFDLQAPWKHYRVRRAELLRVSLDDRLRDVKLEPITIGADHRPRLGGDLDPDSMSRPYRPAGAALWSLEEALPRAAVTRVGPHGPEPCRAWVERTVGDEHAVDGYFPCSDDAADAVGRSADLSGGRWRSVVRVVPRPDSAVRIAIDGVPTGAALVGFAGLSDWAAAEAGASAVSIEWTSGEGPLASVLLPNEAGWREFAAPLPPTFTGRITATVSATRGTTRHVGLAAWVVAPKP
jgi:poly-gamma-glutamate synthesis protein (capsule biosynthesis protein)